MSGPAHFIAHMLSIFGRGESTAGCFGAVVAEARRDKLRQANFSTPIRSCLGVALIIAQEYSVSFVGYRCSEWSLMVIGQETMHGKNDRRIRYWCVHKSENEPEHLLIIHNMDMQHGNSLNRLLIGAPLTIPARSIATMAATYESSITTAECNAIMLRQHFPSSGR